MFRTVPLSIIRSFSLHSQQWHMSYRFADRLLSANMYDIYHCCVCSEKPLMMDRGTVRNMQRFYSKNKFEKLVHLVGFVVRIYYDARSAERQIWRGLFTTSKSTELPNGSFQVRRFHKECDWSQMATSFIFINSVLKFFFNRKILTLKLTALPQAETKHS